MYLYIYFRSSRVSLGSVDCGLMSVCCKELSTLECIFLFLWLFSWLYERTLLKFVSNLWPWQPKSPIKDRSSLLRWSFFCFFKWTESRVVSYLYIWSFVELWKPFVWGILN